MAFREQDNLDTTVEMYDVHNMELQICARFPAYQ